MSQTGGAGGGGNASPTCASCGAPDGGETVICKFCKQAVSADALRSAIPCPSPQCRTLCRWGKQRCVACHAWIVVSCVFCGAISPHNLSSCLHCNEPFAGAPERKAQLEHQRRSQENAQNVGVWGGVAASFLGAAAGSAIGSSWSGGSWSGSSYESSGGDHGGARDAFATEDESADTDDADNDFGDGDSGGDSDDDFAGDEDGGDDFDGDDDSGGDDA